MEFNAGYGIYDDFKRKGLNNSTSGVNLDDDGIEFREINGTSVPIKDGELTGKIGQKIKATSDNSKEKTVKTSSHSEFAQRVCKLKTRDGKPIKSLNTHAEKQMRDKGIYPQNVIACIQKGNQAASKTHIKRTIYDYNGTRIIVDDITRQIVTITYKGKGNKVREKVNSGGKRNNRGRH